MLELCLATDYTDTSQAKSIDLSVDLCPSVAKQIIQTISEQFIELSRIS